MRKFSRFGLLCAVAFTLTLNGCVKLPDGDASPETPPTGKSFDFATTKTCPIKLDYRQNGYSFLIEMYDTDPIEETKVTEVSVKGTEMAYTSEVKKPGLKPIYRGITDSKGRIDDVMDIPTSLKTVYLYTAYAGLPNVVEVKVTDSGIVFDIDRLTAGTKSAAMRSGAAATHKYPANMLVLGDWNEAGVPDYLLPERAVHPAGLMNDLNEAIPYTSPDRESPLWKYLDKSGLRTNIRLRRATPVKLVFADENASMLNVIGYYHYPTDTPPASPDQVKVIIALPNASYPSPSNPTIGGMSSGDQLQLRYWNEKKGAFEEEFPAGTTIGFVVLSSSFKNNANASIVVFNAFYSDNAFNTTETAGFSQHCITFCDTRRDLTVYAFEDVPRKNSISDKYPGGNFRDAFFYVKTTVPGAADPDGMAELPEAENSTPPIEDNYITYTGSLAFEDLWPYEGDYDMNDVVIDYECTLYRNAQNRVIRSVDAFTARHNGGQIATGFGYQTDVPKSQIGSIGITPAPASSSVFKTDSRGMEFNQSKTTVALFDNICTAVGETFTVTTEYLSPRPAQELPPPYNPFVVIHTDQGRGKEVHLPNYAPTDLADKSLLGKGDDISDATKGIYYVSKNGQFPFAIKIPDVKFEYPAEMTRIDRQYPMFGSWVASEGKEYTDWYDHDEITLGKQ